MKGIRDVGLMGSQKGSALVFVVLICAVLLFLGASLLDMSSVDLQIAHNQRDGLQAYYLAETGVESALAVLKKYNTFYTGDSRVTLEEGNFSVSVSALEQANGGRRVSIISVGEAGRVREQINMEFQSFPPFSVGIDGAGLGWYDEADGVIVPGIHFSGDETILLGFPGMDLPLMLQYQEENGHAHFSAAHLFFISSPISLLTEATLELQCETAVLQGSVVLCQQRGSLRFLHPSNDTVTVYFRDQVVTMDHQILLEAGVYHFPHGYQISATSDPSELGNYRVLPLVPGTMVRWGRG